MVSKSHATMCVKRFAYEVPYACVNFDEQMNLLQLQEKPSYNYHINTGMYVLDPAVLKNIKYDEYLDMQFLRVTDQEKNNVTKSFYDR